MEFKRALVALSLERGASVARIADHPVNRVDEFLPWNCANQLALCTTAQLKQDEIIQAAEVCTPLVRLC